MIDDLIVGLSLDEISINGALLMELTDDVDDEFEEELPEDEDDTIAGVFEDLLLEFVVFGFDDEPLGSLSCDLDDVSGAVGVFRLGFGEVCGL
jgi:hypothetical protein